MLRLYSYWRSSSAYRVRIALALKNVPCEIVPVDLLRDGGQQYAGEYLRLNPQGRVPLLVDGDYVLNQSLAILDYLEARHPQPPLLPEGAQAQARVRAFCQTIAADIQPLQNLGVLHELGRRFGAGEAARKAWIVHWIERGLAALEVETAGDADTPFVFGGSPSWADCVLVPQVYNARRYGCDFARFPRLARVAQACEALPAFRAAHPDAQPDRPADA